MKDTAVHLNQMSLVAGILDLVVKQAGDVWVLPRNINTIITAANSIVADFAKPYTPATRGMGMKAWLECDDTGLSSLHMAHFGYGTPTTPKYATPRDSADFGRCIKLIDAMSPAAPNWTRLAASSHTWSKLVESWNLLTNLFHAGKHEELYAELAKLNHGH